MLPLGLFDNMELAAYVRGDVAVCLMGEYSLVVQIGLLTKLDLRCRVDMSLNLIITPTESNQRQLATYSIGS